MLRDFRQLLTTAAARGSAVGAFTCYDLETAEGVIRAATAAQRPVLLLLSTGAFEASGGERLAAALVAAAARSPIPACVQLDHATRMETIERALDCGVGAVLADGSRLPYDDNVAYVAAAVERCRRAGVGVEAELGRVEGDEDVARAVAAGALTDPDQAAAFVAATGTDCLAVSIGNVHGRYLRPPALDWDRLAAVRASVPCPLALHGASGLDDETVRRAVAGGVAKVNVNTELRERYLAATRDVVGSDATGSSVLDLHEAQASAVAAVVAAKLTLYEGERP